MLTNLWKEMQTVINNIVSALKQTMEGLGSSVTYGINCASILMNTHHFDVTKCLPYDIMHILFKGVVPYQLKLLLQDIHSKKERVILTLKSVLNLCLQFWHITHVLFLSCAA